jgi:hypothetical protein
MAAFVKYQQFVEDLGNGVHDLVGTNHTLKVALTNAAPNVATHAVLADITQLTTGGGYTGGAGGGADTQNDGTETGGTLTVTGVDVVFTAAAGTIGPFRYVVLYNDTPTSPADPLIGYWDNTSSVTLADGETFTVDFGASLLTIA